MAPIKFEEDIKDKLDKRTIVPTAGAWEELSNRLDAEQEKSSNNRFWWLGIAASFIGLLCIVSFFNESEMENTIPDTLVNTPVVNEIEELKSRIIEEELKETEEINVVIEPPFEEVKPSLKKHIKKPTEPIATISKADIQLAMEQNIPKIGDDKDIIKYKGSLEMSFEKEKAQEVAEVIFALSETDEGVSDASIDSLLKQAQREILLSKMKNKDQVAIDAVLLLQEVEGELDESFREKVFKAFKSTYGSVKTAIAQRND